VGREGDYGGMEKKFIFFCPLQFVYIRTMVFIVYARCKMDGVPHEINKFETGFIGSTGNDFCGNPVTPVDPV
jgi:hypothetical protein